MTGTKPNPLEALLGSAAAQTAHLRRPFERADSLNRDLASHNAAIFKLTKALEPVVNAIRDTRGLEVNINSAHAQIYNDPRSGDILKPASVTLEVRIIPDCRYLALEELSYGIQGGGANPISKIDRILCHFSIGGMTTLTVAPQDSFPKPTPMCGPSCEPDLTSEDERLIEHCVANLSQRIGYAAPYCAEALANAYRHHTAAYEVTKPLKYNIGGDKWVNEGERVLVRDYSTNKDYEAVIAEGGNEGDDLNIPIIYCHDAPPGHSVNTTYQVLIGQITLQDVPESRRREDTPPQVIALPGPGTPSQLPAPSRPTVKYRLKDRWLTAGDRVLVTTTTAIGDHKYPARIADNGAPDNDLMIPVRFESTCPAGYSGDTIYNFLKNSVEITMP